MEHSALFTDGVDAAIELMTLHPSCLLATHLFWPMECWPIY